MINLDFFPSKRLSWYMIRLFLTRSLGVLVALSLVLMMLNLLSESAKILAVPTNGDAQVWHYVALRLPQIVSFAFPFSLLLGALIAFSGLNNHSEIVAMKAAGLSAHQLLAPMMLAALLLAGASFAFNEFVVTRGTQQLSAWDDNGYKAVPPASGLFSNVWLRDGDDLMRARLVFGTGNATRLEGLTLYQRQNHGVTRIVNAARARPEGLGWRLEDVSTFDVATAKVTRSAATNALTGVDPQRFTLAKVDPANRDFFSLRGALDELRRAGRPTAEAEAGLWHKVSGPLSTVLMPLLAATAAFGLARSGKVLLRATIGMALGFAFFVVDNFALAMGNVGAYPPLLAAWAPFFLFLLIGETVLIRSEE
jgi:lipopolysaccharide export system permease protein